MTKVSPDTGLFDSYVREASRTMEPSAAEDVRPGEWRNIWVWIGRAREEIFPAGLELLGRARELADELGARVGAVVFGHQIGDAPEILGRYGADRVYVADEPRFAEFQIDVVRGALEALVRKRRPEIILFAATIQGRNLAAQLAARLGTGIVPNCETVTVETTERHLVQTQSSFENRLETVWVTPEARPQIATIRPGAYRRPAPDPTRRSQRIDVGPELPVVEPQTLPVSEVPPRAISLEQRDVVLAGGLGLSSKEAFGRLEHLARLLDAEVVGTRAAVTCGWTAEERLLTAAQVRIHPRLYIGFGVVGEYDHLRAIEASDLIVAVTEEADAPICEIADFVALGPPEALLEELIRRVEEALKNRVLVASATPKPG